MTASAQQLPPNNSSYMYPRPIMAQKPDGSWTFLEIDNTGALVMSGTNGFVISGQTPPDNSALFFPYPLLVQDQNGNWQFLKVDSTGALLVNSIEPTFLDAGTTVTFTGSRGYYVCTSTCTIHVPAPAKGYEFCVLNDVGVSTVITFAAIGSSVSYARTDMTAYGTAGLGTMVSGGAIGDKLCILGRDSTHYLVSSFSGIWVNN